jgi:hypothetical protein
LGEEDVVEWKELTRKKQIESQLEAGAFLRNPEVQFTKRRLVDDSMHRPEPVVVG